MSRRIGLLLIFLTLAGLAGCGESGPKKTTQPVPSDRMLGRPTAKS
jgi:predicted small lipoprotein YifL